MTTKREEAKKEKRTWDGRTDSGSPYFYLRQKGFSHREAVEKIEEK